MYLVVGNKSIKIFIKALKFVAKYCQEFIIEAKNNKFQIRTLGSSQLSIAFVSFNALFFVKYEESADQEHNQCRVSAKVLLNVLNNPKSIASCTFKLDVPNDCIRLNIQKHNDFIVKNKISLLENDEVNNFEFAKNYSELTCDPLVFRRILQTSKGIDELEFEFAADVLKIQSYIDYPDEDCETIRLNYAIDTSEFTSYKLKEQETLITSCDDFVNLLNLAQSLEEEVSILFTGPGSPMMTKLDSDKHFMMSIVQSTLPPKCYSKRNIKNTSYKKKIKNYVEDRQNESQAAPEMLTINPSGIQRAISQQISSQNRNSSKRKSIDDNDMNKTQDGLLIKRKKANVDSTVIGNVSILLSQREINEVNDIMSEIGHLGEDEVMEVVPPSQSELPVKSQSELPPTSQSEQSQSEFPPTSESEQHELEQQQPENHQIDSEVTDYSNGNRPRWSIHNSYFNSEDVEKEKENLAENLNDSLRKLSTNDSIENIFGYIFKPRSRIQYGKVLVPGSDSEDD